MHAFLCLECTSFPQTTNHRAAFKALFPKVPPLTIPVKVSHTPLHPVLSNAAQFLIPLYFLIFHSLYHFLKYNVTKNCSLSLFPTLQGQGSLSVLFTDKSNCPEQCLAYGRGSGNTCEMNEWWEGIQNVFSQRAEPNITNNKHRLKQG